MTPLFDEKGLGLDGFNAFHAREIAPRLAAFETARRGASKRAKPFFVGGLAVLAAGIAVAVFHGWIGAVPIVAGLGLAAAGMWQISDAEDDLTAFLIDRLCAFHGFRYQEPGEGFPLERFDDLRVVPPFNRASLGAAMEGSHDGIAFRIIEANLGRFARSGNATSTTARILKGPLYLLSLPAPTPSLVLLTPNRAAFLTGADTSALPGERIAFTEDEAFEAEFQVWAASAADARRLIDAGFRQRTLALADKVGSKTVSMAFDGESLLLALNTGGTMFASAVTSGAVGDPKRLTALLGDLRESLAVIDILGLGGADDRLEAIAMDHQALEAAIGNALDIEDAADRERYLRELGAALRRQEALGEEERAKLESLMCHAWEPVFEHYMARGELTEAWLVAIAMPQQQARDEALAAVARGHMKAGVYWGAAKTLDSVEDEQLRATLAAELESVPRPAPAGQEAKHAPRDPGLHPVTVIDNFHRHDPSERFVVSGFESAAAAHEYAVRRVRSSIEQFRAPEQSVADLQKAWMAMGEELVLANGERIGAANFYAYAAVPATAEEKDYLSLDPG